MKLKLSLQKGKDQQRTIKRKVEFKGISLLSGKPISMIFRPAKENYGIVFSHNKQLIPALIEYLEFSEMHTTVLKKNNTSIFMVEHLLAAIWGLGIDNLKLELSSSYVPARDASSEAFTKTLKQAGIIKQNKERKIVVFQNEALFRQPQFKNRFAKFEPSKKEFEVKSTAPWPQPIGKHTISYRDNPKNFAQEISWARTFLRSPINLKNLAKWENIRSVYKALPQDPKKSPIITYTKSAFITPPKRKDEPARHKVLDFIGDLALVGYRIWAKCTINEPGHKFTHQIAKKIREAASTRQNA